MSITIKTDKREELLNSSIENNSNSANTPELIGNQKVVGIKDTFKNNFTKEMNDYCNNIKSAINRIDDISASSAFKGDALLNSLNRFTNSVKNVAYEYIDRLQDAEEQIIEQVNQIYNIQDEDVSLDINYAANNIDYN